MSEESDSHKELYDRVLQIAISFDTEVYFPTLTPLAIRAGMIDDGNPYFVFKFPVGTSKDNIERITELLMIELKRGVRRHTFMRKVSAAE